MRRVLATALYMLLSIGAAQAWLDVPPASGQTLPMPFIRSGDPFLIPATTAAKQFQITQPPNTSSYRFVNPCAVDIRIKTVSSLTETVTTTSGTRFLARSSETLASSTATTNPRIVSIIALADPGAGGCVTELQYGNGS